MLVFEKVSWAHVRVTLEAPQDLYEFTVCKLAHAASRSGDQWQLCHMLGLRLIQKPEMTEDTASEEGERILHALS